MKKEFAEVGLLEMVEFVIVEKHPTNPEQGIFESHMLCLQKGLESGAHTILIFEDDVFFRHFKAENLSQSCMFLDNCPHWDVFFLGCLTSGSKPTSMQTVVEIHYRSLAHAYAVNRSFAERILREAWNGVPFDDVLRKLNGVSFALYPMIAFQGLSNTDNQTVILDRLRRVFGGLHLIQRANEFYQNNKLLVISAHMLFFLALAGLFITFGT